MQGTGLDRLSGFISLPFFYPALNLPALPNSCLRQQLSPYPVPVEASRSGFCREDLDEGQMLILGKDQ